MGITGGGARISPSLVFAAGAEQAAAFYVEAFLPLFPESRVITTLPDPDGAVRTIEFLLDGQRIWAANGGEQFAFSEGVSLFVACDTQAQVDHLWAALADGGAHQACGWLRDRFGVSWQIVPAVLQDLLETGTPDQVARTMDAVLGMQKLDGEALVAAWQGLEPAGA